jgi:hypothetical protein
LTKQSDGIIGEIKLISRFIVTYQSDSISTVLLSGRRKRYLLLYVSCVDVREQG